MTTPYYTISKNSELTVTIKKSRFICQLFRIDSEETAKAYLEQVKTQHPKANHHCFAYLLGTDDHIQRMSDDGEPSGTAGEPILNALKQTEVHDVLAVVTRYFGGIKLGASGLIRAYNGTTAQAITAVGRVARIKQIMLQLAINYAQVDSVNHFLEQQQIEPQSVTYLTDVQYTLPVDLDQQTEFTEQMTNLLKGQANLTKIGEQFNEVPIDN